MNGYWLKPFEDLLKDRETGTGIEWSIILALFALSAALSIVVTLRLVHQVGDVTEPESAVTTVAWDFARTGKLYVPLDRPPYTPVAYGPAFYMGLAGVARCFHLDFLGLLFAGRVLSVMSFLFLVVIAYVGAVRCGYGGWIAASSAIFLLTDYWSARAHATVRPDMPALLFSVICVVLMLAPTKRTVIVGAVCATLAVLLKPSYVSAPVSVLIWLIWYRRIRYAGWFCFTSAATVLAFCAFFWVRGDPMLSQVAIMRNVAPSFSGLVSLAVEHWRYDSTKFLLWSCITGLSYAAMQGEKSKAHAMLIGLYVVFAWLVAVLTSANSGASGNYYLEPRAACALGLPFCVNAFAEFWKNTAPMRVFLTAALLLAFILQPVMWIRIMAEADQTQKAVKAIAPIVTGKKILSTDSYLGALSSEPEMLDPYLLTQLEKHGYWSSDPILRKVKAKQYDFVIFRSTSQGKVIPYHGEFSFDRAIMAEIQQNYLPVCATSEHLVLIPSNRFPHSAMASLEKRGCHRVSGTFERYVEE